MGNAGKSLRRVSCVLDGIRPPCGLLCDHFTTLTRESKAPNRKFFPGIDWFTRKGGISMKKTPVAPALAEPGHCEKVFREGETELLTVRARWPRLEETSPGIRRLNRYYDALADRWLKRWEGPLQARARAVLAAGSNGEESAGINSLPWSASLDFTVTLFQDGVLSLYLDTVEAVGARRPRRVRQGDAWLLPSGVPLTLRELLPRRRWWRGPVLEVVRRQAGRQLQAGEAVFYDDWVKLMSKRFSPRRFYLTPAGPVVFYPVESVAPAMEGFPTFSLAELLPQEETAPQAAVQPS